MIDPDWIVEDLDPRTWRAIGQLFMPAQYIAAAQPGERGLFVLHDAGNRPRVADTGCGLRSDLGILQVTDPRALAKDLFARGEWDRVHVIDRRHLEHVAVEAQATPRRELSVDAYYHLVYSLIWDGSDGYVSEPAPAGHWHALTYGALATFLAHAPSPSALALCVVDFADVALLVEHGRVVRVTTFEGLPPLPEPSVSTAFLDALWSALDARIAPPYAAFVCPRAVWDTCLLAPDLPGCLRSAIARGDALVRLGVTSRVSTPEKSGPRG